VKPERRLCALLLFCLGPTVWACEEPSLPVIPEEEDIGRQTRRIQRDTERYLESMQEYVACIQGEIEASGNDDGSTLKLALLVRRNNGAVEEFKAITDLYVDRVGPIEDLDFESSQVRSADSAEMRPAILSTINEADEFRDAEPVRCISTAEFRETEVVNDSTVLFFRRSGRVFLNVLEDTCPRLWRSGGFSHQIRGGGRIANLCESDTIYPLEQAGHCRLGEFHEISQLQADALLNPTEARRTGDPFTIEPVELPDEGAVE